MGDENPMSASTGAIKKKKDEKARRRDQRSWDNVFRSVSNMSEADRLAVIQERYNEIYVELRKTSSTLLAMEKQYAILQKERDHIQTELTKNILAKAKLESLCRELQKHNKVIKEENITRVKEEEERRREVATSFSEKLNSLTALMDENKDKSVRLREENMSMTSKLTELYDQFQERESNLANMNRQMDLQKQLSETQLQKLKVEFENERQLFEQERQALVNNLESSQQTNRILEANMRSLQDHLEVYKGQYSDFESTMAKSSKVFDAFKTEMAILQKANAALEQEKNEYIARWQSCTNSVVQMTELHQQASNELKVYEKKMPLLERICRQLQAERSAYQKQLQEYNITPVVIPQVQEDHPDMPHSSRPSTSGTSGTPPPTTLSHTAQKKLTKKEKLLVALKSELKAMEDQLKVATRQQEVARENQEAANKRQEMEVARENQDAATKRQEIEDAIAARQREISNLENEETHPGPSAQPAQIKLKLRAPATDSEQKRVTVQAAKKTPVSSPFMTELDLETVPLCEPEATIYMKAIEELSLVKEMEKAHHSNPYALEDPPTVATVESEDLGSKNAEIIPTPQEDDGKIHIYEDEDEDV